MGVAALDDGSIAVDCIVVVCIVVVGVATVCTLAVTVGVAVDILFTWKDSLEILLCCFG